MSIAKKKTRIGIIKYDKDAEIIAPFNGPNSKSTKKATAFVKGLHPGVYLQTRTDKGLVAAYKELFSRKVCYSLKNHKLRLPPKGCPSIPFRGTFIQY